MRRHLKKFLKAIGAVAKGDSLIFKILTDKERYHLRCSSRKGEVQWVISRTVMVSTATLPSLRQAFTHCWPSPRGFTMLPCDYGMDHKITLVEDITGAVYQLWKTKVN